MKKLNRYFIVGLLGLYTFYADAFMNAQSYIQGFFAQSTKLSPSFYNRMQFLEKIFKDCHGSADLNYALIARMTSGLEDEEVAVYMDKAIIQAKKDVQPVSMEHISNILYDHDYGEIEEFVHEDQEFLTILKEMTAFHESGHAVIGACYDRSKVITLASIQHREKCCGFVHTQPVHEDIAYLKPDFLIQHAQENIMEALAGAISERSFGFHCTLDLQKKYCHQKWGDKVKEKLAVIARHNSRLVPLFMNPGANQDMQHAVSSAYQIMLLQSGAEVMKLNEDQKFEEKVKILSKLYDQTEVLVEQHKDEIKQVAHLLLQQDVVPGSLIYEVCKKNRPEYDFEKEL